MWTVMNKPNLGDAINDIVVLVNHCRSLNVSHIPLLKQLYMDYDVKGYSTINELTPTENVKGAIKRQYDRKMYSNGILYYVRQDLFTNVTLCAMCAINETNELDHFMNKSRYGQLACCRLNLVPTCGRCNNLKRSGKYSKYVHAYYDIYPNVDFLIAKIRIVNNQIVINFSIDKSVLQTNPSLANKTDNQFIKLKLNKRLQIAGIQYIYDEFGSFRGTTDEELNEYLESRLDYCLSIYGRNDWRTSLMRELNQNNAFNINIVNSIQSRPVNGGGA